MAGSEREYLAPPGWRAAPRRLAAADGARDVRGSVLRLHALAGNRAVTRLLARSEPPPRTPADIVRDLEANGRDLNHVRSVANDLLERAGEPRPGTVEQTIERLRALANKGDKTAERLLRELERQVERRNELIGELGRAHARSGPHVDAGTGKEKFETSQEGKLASENPPPASAEPRRAATTAEEAAAAKEGENVAVKEGEKIAVKEAEKTATKGGRLYVRVAAKVGIELLEALVPDPLDAISLMVDFAGAYGEAKEAIRQRKLESGFAIGWAAYLVIPRWEWAKGFAYTTVSTDVATEILGAAGVAENAFNDGLVRGFLYGEKHTTVQSDRVRQAAFDVVLKTTGHTPGRYDDNDLYTFGRDDVYSFAAALRPAVLEVLKEAERRRAARLEQERLAKHAEEVNRRFGTGASWPR
jgi:hypothetical protein